MKKALAIILSALLAAMSVFCVSAEGTGDNFGQVSVNLPDITVELKGSPFGDADKDGIKAYLGDDKLEPTELHKYNQSKDSTRVYMLVDISQTVSAYQNAIRSYIKDFVSKMGENDALVLVTVGSEHKTVLEETNDKNKINETVDALTFNDDYTYLCNALNSVYIEAASSIDSYTRSYILAFTDCDDDTKTGVTIQEIENKYSSHLLPLCVVATDNISKENNQLFSRIARASGGSLDVFGSSVNLDQFSQFTNNIDDVTILKLKADNNNATGDKKNLQISDDKQSFNIDVSVSKSVADKEAPVIKELTYDGQNNRLILTFSEKVTDASSRGAYSVVDADGKKWSVADVEAQTVSDKAELVMSEPLPNGEYTVTAEGLTDVSREKNPLADNQKRVTVSESTVVPIEPESGFEIPIIPIIIVGVLLTGILAAVLIIVLTTRNKDKDADPIPVISSGDPNRFSPQPAVINEYSPAPPSVKHHIKKEDGIKLQLKIKTGKSSEQMITTEVASSVIVGRSSVCEIFIDDAKLSRQHFALENLNRELYISDLNSKNGTFVNGVRVDSRRKVMNHDRILAGLSEITVTITE